MKKSYTVTGKAEWIVWAESEDEALKIAEDTDPDTISEMESFVTYPWEWEGKKYVE